MKDAFLQALRGTFARPKRGVRRVEELADPADTSSDCDEQVGVAADEAGGHEWDPASRAMLTADQREAIDRALRDTATIDPSPSPTRSAHSERDALAAAASQLPLGPVDARTLALILDQTSNDA